MLLAEQEMCVPTGTNTGSLLSCLRQHVSEMIPPDAIPVRFAVTRSDSEGYVCELGVLSGLSDLSIAEPASIFEFVRRDLESTRAFNAVMLIPTGIGAEIGGHAGDATPAARLLASVCDTLVTHPNVVNASDINELPENGLYVEGSVLTRLLMGTAGLLRVNANRVLLVMDKHEDMQFSELTANAASAARTTLGLDCPRIVMMDPPIRMCAEYSSSGCAVGRIEGLERLCKIVLEHRSEFDALAVSSVIDVPKGTHMEYFESNGRMVNPWGGIEAMLTHAISMLFDIPTAHAPMLENAEVLNMVTGIVDPRMAAEAVSSCFLHCVLKGLHRSPRIVTDRMLFTHPDVLTVANVSCLVIPDGCVGLPTLAAIEQGVPVIAVRENRNRMRNNLAELPFARGKLFVVDNYLEAVGVMASLKAGVSVDAVRRPLAKTEVLCVRTTDTESTPQPVAREPSLKAVGGN